MKIMYKKEVMPVASPDSPQNIALKYYNQKWSICLFEPSALGKK